MPNRTDAFLDKCSEDSLKSKPGLIFILLCGIGFLCGSFVLYKEEGLSTYFIYVLILGAASVFFAAKFLFFPQNIQKAIDDYNKQPIQLRRFMWGFMGFIIMFSSIIDWYLSKKLGDQMGIWICLLTCLMFVFFFSMYKYLKEKYSVEKHF
jgi:hypothetical protein